MKKIVLAVCIVTLLLTGCTSKPSKEAVKKSFKAALVNELDKDATSEQKAAVEKYSNCVVDETYSELSARTLKKFVDSKNAKDFKDVNGTKKEKEVLDAAGTKCSNDLLNS